MLLWEMADDEAMKTRTQLPGGGDSTTCHATAQEAHLRYTTDESSGIRRIAHGASFRYRDRRGAIITDARVLERIRKLAVPPAWSDVWICPNPDGHLQATGRDQKGRKQYRYHARWRAVRDEDKYDRLLSFAKVLPRIRRRVRSDLRLPGMPRAKVLATVVQLLESTLMRVGNEEYAHQNGSFGLTTLRNSHARVRQDEIRFEFRGKAGVWHHLSVHDRRLARIVQHCQEIPGQELFQYLDAQGKRHAIDSVDVNNYLQVVAGSKYTAKDFRTWHGTLLAFRAFQECRAGPDSKPTKANLNQCINEVARQLGNTPAVCRQCYIHPALVTHFLDGSLERRSLRSLGNNPKTSASGLRADEAALLSWLRNLRD